MDKIIQMAEAHLQSVNKAISDLQSQRENIDQEIDKLKQYLEKGLEEVKVVRAKDLNSKQGE
jgi:prefoldin subunit 5